MRIICKSCSQEKDAIEFYFRKETQAYKTQCKRCVIDKVKIPKSTTHKVCKDCGEEKLLAEFHKAGGGKWAQPYCKLCDAIRKKPHYAANRERYTKASSERYQANKDQLSAKGKAERAAVRSETLQRRRALYAERRMPEEERKRRKSECDRQYRLKNAERVKANKKIYQDSGRATEMAKKWQAKQMQKIEFRMKKNLRSRIHVALKRGIKTVRTMELLGCTIDEFKSYFEGLFTEGMTWDKYLGGEIVIDHIKPCILFDLREEEQQRKCFHYTNLQPLWLLDNLKKGAKYDGD